MDTNTREVERFSLIKRAKSFTHAGRGLWVFVRTTHAAWIHLAVLLTTIALGVFFHISYLDWMLLTFAAGLVLSAEAFNTAIEINTDLTTKEIHPLARDAKDVAAGAVLIAVSASVVIGVGIFGHYVVEALSKIGAL